MYNVKINAIIFIEIVIHFQKKAQLCQNEKLSTKTVTLQKKKHLNVVIFSFKNKDVFLNMERFVIFISFVI